MIYCLCCCRSWCPRFVQLTESSVIVYSLRGLRPSLGINSNKQQQRVVVCLEYYHTPPACCRALTCEPFFTNRPSHHLISFTTNIKTSKRQRQHGYVFKHLILDRAFTLLRHHYLRSAQPQRSTPKCKAGIQLTLRFVHTSTSASQQH